MNNTGSDQVFYFVVDGFGSASGTFTLAWTLTPPPTTITSFSPLEVCGSEGGQTVTITDSAAYGIIVMQGHGKMGVWDIETPALIRYGQLTNDEFFISEKAAKDGVKIVNNSATDPIVILKHFGPANPDLVL